ncbi:MAG: glycosyltransferase family 4 protein [Candidatus Moranbacteria bacterium]|nr:glycosyltransferase family 4 protein [Candidatus Moranbacteria bacterium]
MDKKILFIVQNLPLPEDRRVFQEMETMSKNGFMVFAIAPGKPDQKKTETIGKMKIWRYRQAPPAAGLVGYVWEYAYSFSCSFYLALKIYFQEKYQVIHISNPPDFFFPIGAFMKLFGVKYVFDQHDLMPEMSEAKFGSGSKSLLRKMLLLSEKLALKFCVVHITTCESGKCLVQKRSAFSAKTFIVRNAVDFSKVYSNTTPKKEIKELSQFKHICAYLGVMGFQDGLDKLLESISYIVNDKNRTDIGFVLMGDGDALPEIKKTALEYGIADQVFFAGWADSKMISTYLNISDLGLMPEPVNSYTVNSLHNKVMEYMAHGLPVVSYDLKEARKSAGSAGVFVSGNDSIKFGQAVLELIGNAGKRQEMGETGRMAAKENFTWEKSGQKLVEAYRYLGF